MPKGVQNVNPEILERLWVRVSQSMLSPLTANKDYDNFSQFIFERTGVILSNSTLRRVFQYECTNHPTQITLDTICRSIGFQNWDDFFESESNHQQYNLDQQISIFMINGITDHEKTREIIAGYRDHPNFFKLLDVVAQIAIRNRDIDFLSKFFDTEAIFYKKHEWQNIFYFLHNFVSSLDKAGLMPELVEYYGASKIAQDCLVERFVDEDHLNGYYYQLLQVYHKHKTTPEALLFYNCLMYQHSIENNLPVNQWLEFLKQFNYTGPIHYLPASRRLATLLIEANNEPEIEAGLLKETSYLFNTLVDTDKIIAAVFMVKLLFFRKKDALIHAIFTLIPEQPGINKILDDRINANQLKIYQAYSFFKKGELSHAIRKLNDFNPVYVNTYIYNHIMRDYEAISGLIRNESTLNASNK